MWIVSLMFFGEEGDLVLLTSEVTTDIPRSKGIAGLLACSRSKEVASAAQLAG